MGHPVCTGLKIISFVIHCVKSWHPITKNDYLIPKKFLVVFVLARIRSTYQDFSLVYKYSTMYIGPNGIISCKLALWERSDSSDSPGASMLSRGYFEEKIASIRNSDAIFSMLRVIKETLSITPPMNLCWLFAMRPATRAAVMTAIIHLPPFIDFSAKIFFLKILSLWIPGLQMTIQTFPIRTIYFRGPNFKSVRNSSLIEIRSQRRGALR